MQRYRGSSIYLLLNHCRWYFWSCLVRACAWASCTAGKQSHNAVPCLLISSLEKVSPDIRPLNAHGLNFFHCCLLCHYFWRFQSICSCNEQFSSTMHAHTNSLVSHLFLPCSHFKNYCSISQCPTANNFIAMQFSDRCQGIYWVIGPILLT